MTEFNFSFDAFVTVNAESEEEARTLIEHLIFDIPYYFEINNLRKE